MLQVNKGPVGPFKIKSVRKNTDEECASSSSCSSGEDVAGTDKPPC